ncbi:hypothetical protein BH09MYX1_BH09MYX1_42570 [soil metagenome]
MLTQQEDPAFGRFADHLTRLQKALQKTSEGSAKISDPSVVGEILTMSGNLLRRSQALASNSNVIDQALKELDRGSIEAFVGTLDPQALCTQVERAYEDAFEALLAETPEERLLFVDSAMEGLRARDRLASVRAALLWADRTAEVGALDAIAKKVDQNVGTRGRMLVALNDQRRRELALLDDDAKKESPWFSSRISCDALGAVLSGKPVDEAHLVSCGACRKDAEAAGHAVKPQHLDARALERLESDVATDAEKQFAEKHIDGCSSCARAVAALGAVDVSALEAAS